jgi:hypothetical protein
MKLKVGVLVVGSLDWESKDYGPEFQRELNDKERKQIDRRTTWRRERLRGDAASEFLVRAPIRYGRKSDSRGDTFTMVFSPECATRLGTAKAIRCNADVSSIDELVAEAEELWIAESSEAHRGKLSANWGCVALVVPEDFLDRPDQVERQALLKSWAARVAGEHSYGKLGFSDRDEAVAGGPVIAVGRLRISWPRLIDGSPLPLDLLLATAPDPQIGPDRSSYPTAKEIADAWISKPKFAYYFRFNNLVGIRTADDGEIETFLTAASGHIAP